MHGKTRRALVATLAALLLMACQLVPTATPAPTVATPQAGTPTAALATLTPAPATPSATTAASTTPRPTSSGAPSPAAQQRIVFAPGAISAQVTGHLGPSASQTYVLGAAAHQTLIARLVPPPGGAPLAILVIAGADGGVLLSDHGLASAWEGVLPSTQDYMIDVRANPDAAVDYSLEVVIPPLPTATPASAQPTRIEFEAGASSTQVTGQLEPSEFHRYVLGAQAGQTLAAQLLPAPAGEPEVILTISGADGGVIISDHALATSWAGPLPLTQDYTIRVVANPSSSVHYTLEVSVAPLPTPAPSGEPTRIAFEPGAISAHVAGQIEPSQSHSYVLRAMAGQKMWVLLLPPAAEPQAILVVWAEDGTVLLSDHALATTWEGILPATQDYFIDVRANPVVATSYTLEVIVLSP